MASYAEANQGAPVFVANQKGRAAHNYQERLRPRDGHVEPASGFARYVKACPARRFFSNHEIVLAITMPAANNVCYSCAPLRIRKKPEVEFGVAVKERGV